MTWFDDGNGWRNEDTEGPAPLVRTKGDWTIFKISSWEIKVQLKHDKLPIRMQFNSVDEAKEFADNYKPVVT
jgi:PIN domain nuclease of toxin-antitoxin system